MDGDLNHLLIGRDGGVDDDADDVIQDSDKINSTAAVEKDTSPFGLTLKKSRSLLDLVERKLFQQNVLPLHEISQSVDLEEQNFKDDLPSKFKASNAHVILLEIGDWKRISENKGDNVAKFYFSRRKLVWDMLEVGEVALQMKLEICWSDISAIKATFAAGQPDILQVELKKAPRFHREINPQPRKHTHWQTTSDFTNGAALIHRQHLLKLPRGTLRKHYENLLQCDHRLFELSQRPFPSSSSPYFENLFQIQDFSQVCRPNFLLGHNQPSTNLYEFPPVSPSIIATSQDIIGVFEPSPSTNGTHGMFFNVNSQATNFPPTPTWNQETPHMVNVYNASEFESPKLLSITNYNKSVSNFPPQRLYANSIPEAETETNQSNSWIQHINYNLLDER